VNNVYVFLGLVTGAIIAVQAAVNSRLRIALGDSSLWAAVVQTVIGLVALVAVGVLTRQPAPATAGLGRHPWWIWTGGFLGMWYVTVNIFLTPRLGAALMLASMIVGQLAAALLVDHYGLFGVAVVRATPARILGVALLVAGVALLRWR
jgi:transporter family-2 protein